MAAIDTTFSKLSAQQIKTTEQKIESNNSYESSKQPEKSLIEGELNFLIDGEIQMMALVPKPILSNVCVSTHHSSTSKSPLAAYGDL